MSNGYEFLLSDQQTVQMPWWWFDALMVWSGVVGAVLWLFGRQLVKPIFAVIMAAAVAGFLALVVRYFSTDMPLIYWLIGGAVVGAAIGWLLARLSLALMFAVFLGVVAPWLVLAIKGDPMPPLGEPIAAAVADLREATAEAVEVEEDAETEDRETRIDTAKLPSLAEAWQQAREDLAEVWGEWWAERSGSTRWAVLSAAGGAVVLGGALAFVLPNLAGAVITALLGVLLMLWPAGRMLGVLPETMSNLVPQQGLPLAILLSLLVLLGALIQWAIFRPRGEK
ncbi:MAG: hypothetical protein WD294_04545 [Phycisphaeraceae bacterium]